MSGSTTSAFGALDIAHDSGVLEPRPWTALQSEWAAELSSTLSAGPILELCAGAGHIGLLAAVLSGRTLVQVEADPVAADFARRNAANTSGVTVEVRNATIAEALKSDENFPLMLADPPYIPTADIGEFPDDPREAIDGGADGLDVIRQCLQAADAHLAPGGAVLLQVRGASQAEAVGRLLDDKWPRFKAGEVRGPDSERAVLLITERTE